MGTRVLQPYSGPRIVTISGGGIGGGGGGGGGPGIQCCCCRCCTCLNLQFLKTWHGIIKLAEILLSAICQSLLIQYGMAYAATMGSSYDSFLTTTSSCLMTTTILVICYVCSDKSFRLIRASLFEPIFNGMATLMYLSAASYLAFAVNVFLWPMYMKMIFFQAYPAMTATYVLGFVLAGIYGIDAYQAYKQFKGIR